MTEVSTNLEEVDGQRQLLDLSQKCLLSDVLTTDFIASQLSTLCNQQQPILALHLYSNQLTYIPHSLFNCSLSFANLTELWLDHNQLTSLPDSIGNLKALKDLSLHENALTVLPHTIGLLEQLEQLRVDRNRLTCLPDELGQCKALCVLHIDGNEDLQTLPQTLDSLLCLQDLGIGSCPIQELPPGIRQRADAMEMIVWRT
jgi:Leucine-rich repeat (LRR) protein